MPRTSVIESPGCAPLRALTTDVLGLVKVAEARRKSGALKVVETWGQPDASSSVTVASYVDCKSEPLMAIARKNGLVELLNPLNGELLHSSKIDQSRVSDNSLADNHVVGLHLVKTKGIDSSSSCVHGPISPVYPEARKADQHVTNVCAGCLIFLLRKGIEMSLWDLTAKLPPNSLGIFSPTWFTAATFLSEDDHRKIIAGTNNEQVCLYNSSAQRRPVLSVNFRESPIKALCEDPDGYTVYVGNSVGDLASFDMRTGKLLGCFKGKCFASIRSIARLSESPIIASCGLDSYLLVWDAKTRQPLSAVFLKQHLTNEVIDSHFSEEGPGGNNCDQSGDLQVFGDTEIGNDEELLSDSSKEKVVGVDSGEEPSPLDSGEEPSPLDSGEETSPSSQTRISKIKTSSGIKKMKSKTMKQSDESGDIDESVPTKRKKSSEERNKGLKKKKSKKILP